MLVGRSEAQVLGQHGGREREEGDAQQEEAVGDREAAAYGLGRKLYMRVFPMSEQRGRYLEISPAPAQAS